MQFIKWFKGKLCAQSLSVWYLSTDINLNFENVHIDYEENDIFRDLDRKDGKEAMKFWTSLNWQDLWMW